MKDTEKRIQFVILRADGKSFSEIAKTLNISKSTCSEWNKKLYEEIKQEKRIRLQELYDLYSMSKEARIESIGKIIQKLDKAIESKDFTELSLDKLLESRLKYLKELSAEYTEQINNTFCWDENEKEYY